MQKPTQQRRVASMYTSIPVYTITPVVKFVFPDNNIMITITTLKLEKHMLQAPQEPHGVAIRLNGEGGIVYGSP